MRNRDDATILARSEIAVGQAPGPGVVSWRDAAGRCACQPLFFLCPCNAAPRRVMLLRQLTNGQEVSKHHLLTSSSMGSIRSERLMRLATGALVLLLVHGLGALRSAWAGCNHLVVSRSDSFLRFDQLDDLNLGNSSEASSDDLTRGSHGPTRNRPCSGMSCSGRVPLPVSTASHGAEGSDDWGALATIPIVASASPSARPSDEPTPRGSDQAACIFHPPRV